MRPILEALSLASTLKSATYYADAHVAARSAEDRAKDRTGVTPPTRVVRLASAGLSRMWRNGISTPPPLDADTLIARAVGAARLDDFGEPGWREPYRLLVDGLRDEADLNPVGRMLAIGQVTKALRDRLRAEALWRAHPEILDQPLAAPIVVLGSMRSGTTRIQRLLACDPRLAYTRLYESMSPVPPRGLDLRPLKTALGLAAIHRLDPVLARIHPTGAQAPDEEFGLLAPSFNGAQFETQWRVPSFTRWWEDADRTPTYRYFRRLLQTIAWQRGGDARPWVLKLPQFTEDLAPLLAAFPDARLLCLSRDPVAVVGSGASLVWHQMRTQSDSIDRHRVGHEWLRKTARRVAIGRTVRRANPQVQQLDIAFNDVDRDWHAQMRRVHAFLGLDLTPEVARRMQAYVGGARAHHGHGYRLEDFGLDEARVHAALPNGG